MLGKEAKKEKRAEELRLAACVGTAWAAIVGRKLRVVWVGNIGLHVSRESYPLPPGDVAAIGLSGPSLLLANGDALTWSNGGWQLVGNIHDGEDS